MRLKNKYKYYDKCFSLVRSFPYKILTKFKKSKWKKAQQFFKKPKKRIIFSNREITRVTFKFWERFQLLYKESLYLKTSNILSHDTAFNLKFYKKNFVKKTMSNIDRISQNFVKPFFSLQLILYTLHFVESSHLSKQMLNTGKIYLNSNVCYTNKILDKGDFVYLNGFKNISKLNNTLTFNYSFVEVDYYTGTFTILKDLNELSFKDLSTILRKNFNFKKFLYYIKKN
jgi:hypothetical protein